MSVEWLNVLSKVFVQTRIKLLPCVDAETHAWAVSGSAGQHEMLVLNLSRLLFVLVVGKTSCDCYRELKRVIQNLFQENRITDEENN